jgi:hypothetical protein
MSPCTFCPFLAIKVTGGGRIWNRIITPSRSYLTAFAQSVKNLRPACFTSKKSTSGATLLPQLPSLINENDANWQEVGGLGARTFPQGVHGAPDCRRKQAVHAAARRKPNRVKPSVLRRRTFPSETMALPGERAAPCMHNIDVFHTHTRARRLPPR